MRKTCLTCRYEPKWVPSGFGQSRHMRGQCKFRGNSELVRKLKLPQGAQIVPPWVERDKPKQGCGAWEAK